MKLTLSLPGKVILQAKVLARDRHTTVSQLVEEGLGRVREPDLRSLSEVTFRAWHHFKDATPFIPLAIIAFRDLGFRVEPQLTGFRVYKGGRRYVVKHKKTPNGMLIQVHRWGERHDIISELNVTRLAERLEDRALGIGGYLEIVREVSSKAALVSVDADAAA
jgi:hypothetical protein